MEWITQWYTSGVVVVAALTIGFYWLRSIQHKLNEIAERMARLEGMNERRNEK